MITIIVKKKTAFVDKEDNNFLGTTFFGHGDDFGHGRPSS